MAATKPALASGGITHCRLRWGLSAFFLESFRSCCRWPSRRCSIRQLSPRAGASSNGRTPREPASRSERSISPPRPRRKPAAGRSSDCICGSAPPRALPRRADAGYDRSCRYSYPVPQRSRCRSTLRPPPTRPPSRGSAPSSANCAGCLPEPVIASSRSRSSALNLTTYFLTAAISLPATNHLHRRIAATEIQKNTAPSMTPPTRNASGKDQDRLLQGRATQRPLSEYEKFDFLGYCFRTKAAINRNRKLFTGYGPQASASSLKAMRQKIRELKLRRRTHVRLTDIARDINPILQGWLNYYGRYSPAALHSVWKYNQPCRIG